MVKDEGKITQTSKDIGVNVEVIWQRERHFIPLQRQKTKP